MKTWLTINGCKIHRVLSGRSNAYLIPCHNNSILVDTGKKTAFGKLCSRLDSLSIPVEKIQTLVLTHTHFDHCQSAKQIMDRSNCRIIVSDKARENIRDGFTRLSRGTSFMTDFLSKTGNSIGQAGFGYEPFQADTFVRGNLTIYEGKSVIRIIETKGHSDDSVSILVDNEIAIVGDVMFGIFGNSIFPPYADDIPEMLESWKVLLETDCKTFLPGHGGEIPRNRLEKELHKYSGKFKFQ